MNDNLFNNSKVNNKKFNIAEKKKNTIKSLSDVELFLRNFHKLKNYIKLYKIIK